MNLFSFLSQKTKKAVSLECIYCKQSKTHIYCSDASSKYNKDIITAFSKRIPDYCYLIKRQLKEDSRCMLPLQDDEALNKAFLDRNKIEPHLCSQENGNELVFISLSGRKYHSANCTQIKGTKYATSAAIACRLGYSPAKNANRHNEMEVFICSQIHPTHLLQYMHFFGAV